MANWIMQCNPLRFDIERCFALRQPIGQWSVTRNLDDMRAGDRVALWLSGKAAGVYVLGSMTGPPFEDVAGPLWCPDDRGRPMTFAAVELGEFLPIPILRTDLMHDPRFESARIIRQPNAGNPFLTTDDEWSAIRDFVRIARP